MARSSIFPQVKRRFGSEKDVEDLTGISHRTLQQDRREGNDRFPFYRSGRRVLYDLLEVQAILRRSRQPGNTARGAAPGDM